jgi:hypothetical protein
MIKPNELRIGNLIQDVGEGEIYTVTDISDDEITAGAMTVYSAGFYHEFYIPLSDEWLNRMGIVYDGQISTSNYWYNRENQCFCQDYSEGDGGAHIIAECLYVHQLQNLYFALTGNELTIKP